MIPSLPEPLASATALVVGLLVGSFLNVCIYRLPVGESVVTPASRCPKCGTSIRWWQNVPVASWVLLRGRCAACGAPIHWRYPLVEALTGLLTLALWRQAGWGSAFAIATPFAWMLIVLFFTDLDTRLLPDAITLPGFGLGVATAWFNPFLSGEPTDRVVASLAGAALGAGMLWGVGAIWSRARGVEAMGFGDVKMMAMVGAFTGPVGVLGTIFLGSAAGAMVGVLVMPLAKGSFRGAMQAEIPFGCFLAPSALAALLWGRTAFESWLRWFPGGP